MAWTSGDKSFKTLINRRATSSSKASYEEIGDRTLNIHLDEVWIQGIPSDPAQAVINGVAEQRTLFTLTEDVTVGSHQCYYADVTGTRLGDWISDKYGTGYAIHLYQSTNVEIFPTDSSGWIFDYTTGILTLNSTTGLSLPLKISGYRYIGTKGVTGIVGITGSGGGSGVTGIQGYTGMQGVTGVSPPSVSVGSTGLLNIIIDGGGEAISAGIKGDLSLPFNFYIDSWKVYAKETGSILLGVWKSSYSDFPPTSSNAMHSGATGPNIVAGIKGTATTSGWGAPTGSAQDVLRINVDSASSVQLVSLMLNYHKV